MEKVTGKVIPPDDIVRGYALTEAGDRLRMYIRWEFEEKYDIDNMVWDEYCKRMPELKERLTALDYRYMIESGFAESHSTNWRSTIEENMSTEVSEFNKNYIDENNEN